MNIPLKVRRSWKLLYSHGDFQKIHKLSKEDGNKKVSIITIANAFKTGSCIESTFEVMNKFFIEKKKMIDKQEKKLLEDDGN